MYYVENNRTYGIGSNPNGGAWIRAVSAHEAEVKALDKAGFGVVCQKGWSSEGDYFFETDKIYARETRSCGGVPCDGGPNSEYEDIMKFIKKFEATKLSSLEELDSLPGLSDSSYGGLIALREEVFRNREKLAREGKRHSRCLFEATGDIFPETTREELVLALPLIPRIKGKDPQDKLLAYLRNPDYKWRRLPDAVFLATSFGLDARFVKFFASGGEKNTGPNALYGTWLKKAREIRHVLYLVRLV